MATADRQRYTGVRGNVVNGAYPLYASSIHKLGDMMIWDTTNAAQIAATAGDNMAAISGNDNLFLGRATEDYATLEGTVKTRISVIRAAPWVEFMLWIYNATAGSTVPAPLTQLGVSCNVWYQSAALGWAAEIADTTDKFVTIAGYLSGKKGTDGLPNWPDSATAGTNTYPAVWAAPLLASCATVR